MKNLKKALSMVLASAMLFGMMVVGTGAAHADVTAEHNEEAIAVVSAAGIMGANEEFNPDAKITRNEMAVVMVNMLGLKTSDYAGASQFTDVPAWAADYVDACYANGIVSGVSATEFNGAANVTTAEAALMVMKALGYFEYPAEFGTDWLLATVKQASKIELLDGIDAKATAAMTRNEVAQLVLNALEATMVEAEMEGTNASITAPGVTVEIQGTVDYTNVPSKTAYNKIIADNYMQLGEDLFEGDLVKDTQARNSFGVPATEWTFDGDSVGKFAIDAEKVYTVDFDADELADLVDADYVLAGATVYINGDEASLTAAQLAARDYIGTTIELYSTHATNEKVITDIVVKQGYLAKVTNEDDKNVFVTIYNPWMQGGSAAVHYADDTKKTTDTYDKLTAAYDKDDYFMIFVNGADTRNAVIGHAAVKSEDVKVATTKIVTPGFGGYFTADGTKYELASAYMEQVLTVGNEYTIFFDEAGYVIGAKPIEEAAAALEDVYYVVKEWSKSGTNYGNENYTNYFAQLVDMNGEKSEIELEKAYNMAGQLVTVSDKKWSETVNNATVSYKADNDKFDLTVWAPSKTWDKDTATYTDVIFAKDDARKNLGTTYRLNDATKYIMISESGSDLAVKVAEGGIALAADGMTGYVITEKDKTVAKYVIIVSGSEIVDGATFSTDLIFVNTVDYETGDGFVAQEVIFADGSKKVINIDVADAKCDALNAKAFYAYDKNDEGYYVLDAISAGITIAGETWKDEEGVLVNVSFIDLFEDLLTVTNAADIDVSAAKFVDAHDIDAQGQYTSLVADLAALNELDDMTNYNTSATLSLSVDEDGAVLVILTSLTHNYSAI